MSRTTIAILGISGRMGRTLLTGIENSSDLKLSGGLDSADSRWNNQDAAALNVAAAGVIIAANPLVAVRGAQAAIAFALPQGTPAIVAACAAVKCPLVLGTTGHDAAQLEAIAGAAKHIPIVMASNFSLGVNLLFKLAELTAGVLGVEYDAEIFEAHHRHKKDAPSGTALSVGEAVAKGRGTTLAKDAVYARHGDTGAREIGKIGFSVMRGGDIVGDHTLTFAGNGELFELTHRAQDRMAFASGALHAARWAIGKPPGKYSMRDVLNL
jgi:4-hydroxy-tetrahydrodipicolinate reductase